MADKLDMTELGTTGLRRTGGRVQDEFINALRGEKGRRVYREMAENDPIIGAILFAVDKIVCRLDWDVRAHSDDMEDERVAFIQECLEDMSDSWDETLSEILSMCVFGWSYHEIVYKRRGGSDQKDPSKRSKFNDGKIGWRKWGIRAQETLLRWQFDPEDGSVIAMEQMDTSGKGLCIIPIEKALLFRMGAQKGSPEGKSMLRTAFRSWYFKKRIEEYEASGLERDLSGLPVAWVPAEWLSAEATPAQKQVVSLVTDIVQNIKRNEQEGVVFPMMHDESGNKQFDLTLLSAGGRRQFDTDQIIQRYDQRIAMSVLADFMLLGHQGVGSFALGSSKMDLWTMAVDGIAKSIAEVVNQYAIPRLLRLNNMDTETPPRLTYGEVNHVDLAEMSGYISQLVGSGALVVDDDLEEHLRGIAGLPPADPDSAEERKQQNQPPAPNEATGAPKAPESEKETSDGAGENGSQEGEMYVDPAPEDKTKEQ